MKRAEKANVARLAGIEPTTSWFEARHSIQLSYSRINMILAYLKKRTQQQTRQKSKKPNLQKSAPDLGAFGFCSF